MNSKKCLSSLLATANTFLGMSKQEDVHRAERPLEKTREIDNEARILKEAEMKRKLNRNQMRITP